jgi:hypothetical protein
VEGDWGGVVEGVVSGLLRSKREEREPRTPQFSNQIDATDYVERYRARHEINYNLKSLVRRGPDSWLTPIYLFQVHAWCT